MKALNRAIARTVSQIARHAGEGCHVPMIMALENHLDALLTMERKMLEGVQEVAGTVPSYSWFTPEQGMTYGSWYEKEKEQPVPAVKLYGGVSSSQSSSYVVGGIGGAGSQSLPGGGAGILQPNVNSSAQPAPDVIDMTDPANWQVGDVVVCNDLRMTAYSKEFVIVSVEGAMLRLKDGEGYMPYFADAGDHFTWLRHGEAQS